MRINKEQVLELTDNGRMLFEAYLPELTITGSSGDSNVTSPFTNKPNSLSVFSWDKWLFKDYSKGGIHGDIFYFIALLNHLDCKKDFKKILLVIESKLKDMGGLADSFKDTMYENQNTNEVLVLADKVSSKPFIKSLFGKYHSLMIMDDILNTGNFEIKLCKGFEVKLGKETIKHEFNWAKPKSNFFAITIEEGRFYILYNPSTRKFYEWGDKEDNHVIGWKEALKAAFVDYLPFRKTLAITNTITVMLNLQALNIPCIAFLNEGNILPAFFEKVIAPLFGTFFLMYEKSYNSGFENQRQIAQDLECEILKPTYIENGKKKSTNDHWIFFEDHINKEGAIDSLFDCVESLDDIELAGLKNPITIHDKKCA